MDTVWFIYTSENNYLCESSGPCMSNDQALRQASSLKRNPRI